VGQPTLGDGRRTRIPLIGVSCHSLEQVSRAKAQGANFAVFAPVFEKKDAPGSRPAGLEQLRAACQESMFQENDVGEVVRCLRSGVIVGE